MVDLGVLTFGFGGTTGLLTGLTKVLMWLFGGVIFIGLVVFLLIWRKNKKSFNIPITIWIPRSDGTLVDEISAKGGYFKSKAVGGITTFRVKRRGVSIIDIPPPSSRYLVGLSRHLYLIQKGMDDFEPVIPKSFLTVETDKKDTIGNPIRKAVVNLNCRNQEATAWMFDNAENAKKRFTIWGLWERYKDFIEMSIFCFIVMLAVYINWHGLKDVVNQMARLVDILVQYNSKCPIVS